jgi:hypothetical protein
MVQLWRNNYGCAVQLDQALTIKVAIQQRCLIYVLMRICGRPLGRLTLGELKQFTALSYHLGSDIEFYLAFTLVL